MPLSPASFFETAQRWKFSLLQLSAADRLDRPAQPFAPARDCKPFCSNAKNFRAKRFAAIASIRRAGRSYAGWRSENEFTACRMGASIRLSLSPLAAET